MTRQSYHDPHLGELLRHERRPDTLCGHALLTPKHAVAFFLRVAGTSDETEDVISLTAGIDDVIASSGRLFAAIRRNDWAYRLALADAFLALMAVRGEDDHSGMGRAEAARLCSMNEVIFHEPGAGAWIEYNEKLDYYLKPDFGVWVHSNGALLGTSVIEAF